VGATVVRSAILGLVAGVVAGLFGVGGGVIVVPGLVLWIGLTQYRASGTSVAAIVASSAAALVFFAIDGKVDWWAALLIFAGAGTGAWFGTRFVTRIPEPVLTAAFAAILLIAAVRLWF